MLSNYPDILTTKDACELLKISRHTIYKLIHANEIKAKKVARHYRITKYSLIQYLSE